MNFKRLSELHARMAGNGLSWVMAFTAADQQWFVAVLNAQGVELFRVPGRHEPLARLERELNNRGIW